MRTQNKRRGLACVTRDQLDLREQLLMANALLYQVTFAIKFMAAGFPVRVPLRKPSSVYVLTKRVSYQDQHFAHGVCNHLVTSFKVHPPVHTNAKQRNCWLQTAQLCFSEVQTIV
jgi:hypothetical protein